MINIKKAKQPRSLTEYRCQPGANYDDFREKQDVKKSLLIEQGFICAYCMRRIGPDTAQIEHIAPQNPEEGSGDCLALDYSNMLAVCDGYKGLEKAFQTCDTHKDNKLLKKANPLDENSVNLIKYRTNGIIYSEDSDINDDLNVILNLNCERAPLIANRKATINVLQKYMIRQQRQGSWNQSLLKRAQKHFETRKEGLNNEYIGVILYFIKRYERKDG